MQSPPLLMGLFSMSDRNGSSGVKEIRNDGALLDAYAAIGNPYTGIGTLRDPLQNSQVQAPAILSDRELEHLYRASRICEKAVRLLPEAAAQGWVEWHLGESSIETSDIDKAMKELQVRKCFARASILGRWYGDGYILMGLDDGQMWDEPVNEEKIQSIRWLRVLTHNQLIPDWSNLIVDYEEPEHYRFYLHNLKAEEEIKKLGVTTKVHKSRVLRFPGKRLYSELLQYTSGENDSILQGMFDAFNAWTMSLGASAAMIQDHSVFTYKLNGLSKLVQGGQTGDLVSRFQAIQMGKSVLKGLMMDADNEEAAFISRNYGGVKDILQEMDDRLVAEADMPASQLLGSPKSGGFSESGLSDRMEWAACTKRYQESFWREPLEVLLKYVLLSDDFGGSLPDSYGFEFKSILQLTRQEEADIRFKNAQVDRIYKDSRILHPTEIRQSRYGGQEYQDAITLDPDVEEELLEPPQPPQQAIAPQPSNNGKPAPVAAQQPNLDQLRSDAAMGLIPRSYYLEAAGYRVNEVEAALNLELRQDTGTVDAYRTDECLRDERGRFAGGNCGGGGKGGGGGASLKERIGKLKEFAAGKLKDQAPDLIVNTGGLVGSIVGQHLAGDGGALAGDLIGALATRQVVAVSQAAITASQRLRNSADFQVANRIGQLRQLGRATLSEFNSPAFQRQLGNDLTGDLAGWAIGNSAAIAGNRIPGVSRIPLKGAAVAMATVPRVATARERIIERTSSE